MSGSLDPVTIEVIQEYLISTVREMRITMIRTAYSSVIYEGHDFSCAILDESGNLIVQSEDNPSHVLPLASQVQRAQRYFGEELHEGDVILVNDPYTSGTHLNDVAMIIPHFSERLLQFFSVVRAHWADVGGMTPGSISGKASEIYQEGLRIPFIKLYERGRVVAPLLEMILANVRLPKDREGDLRAMLACCRVGDRRLAELEHTFGLTDMKATTDAIIARAESRMCTAIQRVEPGVYRYEDYLDSDNTGETPVLLRVAITISGDKLTADFSGSSPQMEGPINASHAVTAGGVFIAVKALLDPQGPINQGTFRPIEVLTKESTVVDVQVPGAVGGFSELRRRVESVVMGALASAAPKYVAGDVKGSVNHTYISCQSGTREGDTIFYEFPAGGTGGFLEADGNNVLRAYDEGDFSSIQSVESVEIEHQLLVECSSLRIDSCGDGASRGGLGLHREVRMLAGEGRLSVLADRSVIPPFGVYGGYAGAPNRFYVIRNEEVIEPSSVPGKVSGFRLLRGDIVVMETAGGGGYGCAIERPQAKVKFDLAEGYITNDRARRRYGVEDTVNGEVESAPAGSRRDVAGNPVVLVVDAQETDTFLDSKRICELAPGDAETLFGNGQLIELVNSDGAPLRAWVGVDSNRLPGSISLGPVACDILRVKAGDSLQVRALVGGGSP